MLNILNSSLEVKKKNTAWKLVDTKAMLVTRWMIHGMVQIFDLSQHLISKYMLTFTTLQKRVKLDLTLCNTCYIWFVNFQNSDNDRSSLNCASMLKGGWWWKSCGRGLNGLYMDDPNDLTARQGELSWDSYFLVYPQSNFSAD